VNPYESDKLLAEYLLFHYGTEEETLPFPGGPREALEYPVRCVRDCVDLTRLDANSRALDLGCAVGRSSFELARHCRQVIAIDSSHSFIEAATTLRNISELSYNRVDEGELTTPLVARAPADVDSGRLQFEVGDAQELRDHLGAFDVLLMANLIDRLTDPVRCLTRLSGLVNPRGQLIITSPYTWLPDFTPRDRWLGGFEQKGERQEALAGLEAVLGKDFELTGTKDLPFLIREHARKYQWSVAQASLWRRR
jgi:putative 4-mercaptohistidine N1-methyltranferase